MRDVDMDVHEIARNSGAKALVRLQ